MATLNLRARIVAAELKAARTAAGISTRQAARHCALSNASINRTENALRSINLTELGLYLATYNITGPTRKLLIDLTTNPDIPWLTLTHPGLLAAIERDATSTLHYSVTTIPTALLAKPPRTPTTVILDEAALRRGISTPVTTATQLNHLLTLAPHVDIRVIPFKHGPYLTPGPFTAYRFPKQPPLTLINDPTPVLIDETDPRSPQTHIPTLLTKSLPHDASADLIHHILTDHEKAAVHHPDTPSLLHHPRNRDPLTAPQAPVPAQTPRSTPSSPVHPTPSARPTLDTSPQDTPA
ncbi:Scr1 family TA system antitoxin-like transcriptional regulator [Actinokineospora pegani]|uniref:Scr1 family TA system antitoxin-like transcriptional regulator n=1 Tax=Actinokineospora pegani TaxID=2654637 RepID=UPI0012EA558D|nr:Scr1 family TA system antitoxin-like transcriptional regulator [Actinokineospora pegani]